jgi:hypothetical protein
LGLKFEGVLCVQDKAKAIAARYDNNYSRWEGWEPDDPVTEEEKKRAEEEKERQDNEVFEKANAEFCNQVRPPAFPL